MLDLEALQRLLGIGDSKPPKLNALACLNARHKERHCEACLACPAGAIQLEGPNIILNVARCIACGLCVGVCPVGALTDEDRADADILRAAAGPTKIEWGCFRMDDAETPRYPGIKRVGMLPCLARLSPDLLVGLAAEHEQVWLNDSACARCPIGQRALPQIKSSGDQANTLLASWGREDVIHRYSESAPAPPAVSEPAGDSGAGLSRREFFTSLKRNVTRTAGAAVAAALPEMPGETSTPAVKGPSTLGHALKRLGAPAADRVDSTLVATAYASEACSACGLCAKICPTGALHFHVKEDAFVLAFQARECLGVRCRLCELICRANAIALSAGAASADLVSDEPKTLLSGGVKACAHCSVPFAPHGGEALCPVCADAQKKEAALLQSFRRS